MISIEREQVFPTPVEHGFQFITDIDNWRSYWPGLVRVDPGSLWRTPGDQARVTLRLFGREVELTMTLREFVPNQRVIYDSVQRNLPNARHERHFRPVEGGFSYRILVEYEPRAGIRGLFDRSAVRRGVDRAVQETLLSLERLLVPPRS